MTTPVRLKLGTRRSALALAQSQMVADLLKARHRGLQVDLIHVVSTGDKAEDIVKGAFRSVVKRLLEMDIVDGALVMTGGVVAHNPVLVTLAEEAFGRPALVPADPQHVGAFGAALEALARSQGGEPAC